MRLARLAAERPDAELLMRRPIQTNCQQEPHYPGADTVACSLRYPELTAHHASDRCPIEAPHLIADCGEFAGGRLMDAALTGAR